MFDLRVITSDRYMDHMAAFLAGGDPDAAADALLVALECVEVSVAGGVPRFVAELPRLNAPRAQRAARALADFRRAGMRCEASKNGMRIQARQATPTLVVPLRSAAGRNLGDSSPVASVVPIPLQRHDAPSNSEIGLLQ